MSGGERLRITGIGGSLGIGQTNPEQTLHVVGTSTVTGNSFFGGTVSIIGNTTVNANLSVDSLTVPSLNAHIIGNNAKIHSTSGISTVAAFRATGISTFFGNVTVTDGNTFQVNDGVNRFFVSASGKVGIKTGSGQSDVTIAGDTNFKTSVSVGSTARCAVDFSEVVDINYNDGSDRSVVAYMLPPIVTAAQRNALVDRRNFGNPVIDFLQHKKKYSIIELSSFQLEKLNKSLLDLSVVTNISPDHLDFHGNFENYKKAKLKICNNRAKTFFANTNMSLKDFAFEIASSLEKIDSNTSRSLNELPHRLEEVIPGIINDSKSTNSASLLYAIKKLNFDGNLIICGDPRNCLLYTSDAADE